MKLTTWMLAGLLTAGLALGGCTAEVEDPGRAPDVDVSPGEAPDIDVDPARVDVTTDTQQVVTPDVDITPVDDDTTAAPR